MIPSSPPVAILSYEMGNIEVIKDE